MTIRCKQDVLSRGLNFPRYRQCARKAVRDGFCAQHHPDAVALRKKKSEETAARRHRYRMVLYYNKLGLKPP